MAEGLTVDNLCDAVRFSLREMLANPEKTVDQSRGLVLYGSVGDNEMQELLNLFGGTIKITVQEPPAVVGQPFVTPHPWQVAKC